MLCSQTMPWNLFLTLLILQGSWPGGAWLCRRYSGTRHFLVFLTFCVLTGISLEPQVRTKLNFWDKIPMPSTITIIPKKISMQVQSEIMGCNGKVVLGAYILPNVFRTDLAHLRSTILHTPSVDLILPCLLQCCGTRQMSTRVFFPTFF